MMKQWCDLTTTQQDNCILQQVETFRDDQWYKSHGFGLQEECPAILATWPESCDSLITDY